MLRAHFGNNLDRNAFYDETIRVKYTSGGKLILYAFYVNYKKISMIFSWVQPIAASGSSFPWLWTGSVSFLSTKLVRSYSAR